MSRGYRAQFVTRFVTGVVGKSKEYFCLQQKKLWPKPNPKFQFKTDLKLIRTRNYLL
jgi:hypothetical protein